VKRVASQHIFKRLWDEHLRHRADDMSYLYRLFRYNEITAVAAGWIFESRMHQLLREEQTIRLFPIAQAVPGSANFISNFTNVLNVLYAYSCLAPAKNINKNASRNAAVLYSGVLYLLYVLKCA